MVFGAKLFSSVATRRLEFGPRGTVDWKSTATIRRRYGAPKPF